MSFSNPLRTMFTLVVCVTLVTAIGCKKPKEKEPAPGDAPAQEETTTPDEGTAPGDETADEKSDEGEKADEPKPEEKPAAEPKPEEKPAAEPKPEEKPAAEPKPEEKPAAEPKPEEKPAAEPKPEEKPAAEPKPEEKPAAEPKPEEKTTADEGPKGAKVELLMELPDTCNTPDGMCLLPDNSILLSCPNVNDPSFPPVVMRITPDNKLEKWIDPPMHPKTGKAYPFGVCVDAEGKNVYLTDLQWFANPQEPGNNARILQIPLDEKYNPAGEPKVICEGAVVANAVVARDGIIYFTDTVMVPGTDPLITGVFRVPLSEAADGPVQLKTPLEKEPHLIATIPTANVAIGFGADGLTFDDDGNMYVANFADGRIDKVTFDADGKPSEPVLFAKDPAMKCCDGIFYDKKRKKIFVADSIANAVQIVDMDGKVTTLASDSNNTGAGGRLDQPCEVLIRGNEVIVSNMDFPIPTGVNTTFDKPYTLSIIKLEE